MDGYRIRNNNDNQLLQVGSDFLKIYRKRKQEKDQPNL